MSKTIEEIGIDVLRKIGELSTGQTARAADLKVCTEKYNAVWAMLQAPELLADWAVGADIPTEDEDPIAAIVAFYVRTYFSVKGQTLASVEAEGNPTTGTAYDRLRQNRHTNWTGDEDPTETEYF